MNQPLVSVVVPNYNYSRFFDVRMESILNQSFQNFEIILLDDASTDNSVEVMAKYKGNPKVTQFVINERNSGSPFAQWRKGVELARGKYVWIAEADDLSYPEFLGTCVSLLEKHDRAVTAFSGSEVIDASGNKTNLDFDALWPERNTRDNALYKVFGGLQYIVHNMYWGSAVYNASGTVFRRSMVDVKDFEECSKMRNSGDWLFWTKLMAKGEHIEIYRRLNRYRVHGKNTTEEGRASGNLELEDMKVISYIENHFPIGWYRRTLRHGQMIKRYLRSEISDEMKTKLLRQIREELGATMWSYRFECIHKIFVPVFPFLLSLTRDRI